MKAKKLVTLALPIMLLGGCGTDKAEEKKTDSIKVSEESSKEVSKTDSLKVAVDYKTSILDLSKALESKLSAEELKGLLMNAKV
ncbi:hypothetical protein [Bacillus sp. BP-3]|uniref:hypothetical protein n=1 Tax=Bacillus sp. BP-3 TaxID=3022773 RepID=UPI00232E18D8|nr:hypothetical protein [Bacillus sp. BP-3]MDC2864570.1 hypothetical protein [Bacillus sp. BP-3]